MLKKIIILNFSIFSCLSYAENSYTEDAKKIVNNTVEKVKQFHEENSKQLLGKSEEQKQYENGTKNEETIKKTVKEIKKVGVQVVDKTKNVTNDFLENPTDSLKSGATKMNNAFRYGTQKMKDFHEENSKQFFGKSEEDIKPETGKK